MSPTKTKPVTDALETLKTLGIDDPAVALHDLISERLADVARRASESLPAEGALRGLPTGEILLTLEDQIVKFRPVRNGDLVALRAMNTAGGDECRAWWRKAAELLGDSPLPADELLPPWLDDEFLPVQTYNFWNLVPTAAPGA